MLGQLFFAIFISASPLDEIRELQTRLVVEGFEPALQEALAYVYEAEGEFALANAIRLGPDLNSVPMKFPEFSNNQEAHIGLPLDGPIHAAIRYFQRRGSEVDPPVAVLFEFLGRKFGLAWTDGIVEGFVRRSDGEPYLRALRRLIDPEQVWPSELTSLGSMDSVVLPALYCRERDLPDDFFARLFWRTQLGGYELTHATGSLVWALEQGCLNADSQWRDLLQMQIALLESEAAQGGDVTDLFIEKIAFLFYAGARDRVEPRWIERIVRALRSDGGWGDGLGNPSNDHTTHLALWVLLEAANPTAPRVSMIRN